MAFLSFKPHALVLFSLVAFLAISPCLCKERRLDEGEAGKEIVKDARLEEADEMGDMKKENDDVSDERKNLEADKTPSGEQIVGEGGQVDEAANATPEPGTVQLGEPKYFPTTGTVELGEPKYFPVTPEAASEVKDEVKDAKTEDDDKHEEANMGS